ncbi:cation:proton antiporter [Qingshengfaniella alkalisoli]|uniref:Sodium:proton antiporter n=1 Tax=Qingshengfaniella alkalisoli TaxID=2599296 RepID=A0A5B8J2G2_9RHOB|nr:sodium:proton antiporter [Qingshengfaniella alkalisoli]QDY68697.1 sodium:proton antiporter [Qingshengfaniella alkalisoli]
MNTLQIASLVVVLAGLFGAVNSIFLKLPASIGILAVSLIASIGVLLIDLAIPGLGIADSIRTLVNELHFSEALLEGMLGLLLFAGALHVNVSDLRKQWVVVLVMATIGVGISTVLFGMGAVAIFGMPLIVALVFGAIVSPTDPVAVLGVLRESDLDPTLETQIAGESLFNDGVGYVLFLVLVGLAFPTLGEHHADGAWGPFVLFFREALGGALLGLVLGWITFRIMRSFDDYPVEVLLTLGLAFGGYALADAIGVSAPIAAVTAGLLIGEHGSTFAMSKQTREAVDGFWKMVDAILNALLFMMIGFELFFVTFSGDMLLASIAAIAMALLARLAAVAVPVLAMRRAHDFVPGVIPIMTWGGLKGGISIALALSLPNSEWKPEILTATYVIVVFSILVQGLTVGRVARHYGKPA